MNYIMGLYSQQLINKVIQMYEDGNDISTISEELNIREYEVYDIVNEGKDELLGLDIHDYNDIPFP